MESSAACVRQASSPCRLALDSAPHEGPLETAGFP
jgi:hypothetical protein